MPVLMDGKNLHTGNIKQIYLTVDVGRGWVEKSQVCNNEG